MPCSSSLRHRLLHRSSQTFLHPRIGWHPVAAFVVGSWRQLRAKPVVLREPSVEIQAVAEEVAVSGFAPFGFAAAVAHEAAAAAAAGVHGEAVAVRP